MKRSRDDGDGLILMGLVVMAVVGIMLLAHSGPRPMICRVWSFEKWDWKTVMCIERPHVRQEKWATDRPESTETGYPWPTATEGRTPSAPTETPSAPTETVEPYPAAGTATPGEPYP